jgi:hypothetical protein
LPGQTYKIRWPDSEHALYITLNDIIQDGRRRPFEIFINSKNMEHYAWTVAPAAGGCRARRPRRQHGAGIGIPSRRAAAVVGRAATAMPEMRRGGPHSPRRLRPVHQLRLLEMRVSPARGSDQWH